MNKTEYFKVFFIFNFLVIFFILFPLSAFAATTTRGCETDVYKWGVRCNWDPNYMSWSNLQANGPGACVVESTTACPTNTASSTWSFSCQINGCALTCNSGYTNCAAEPRCRPTIPAPTGCHTYNTCSNCCSTCSPGYSKSVSCGTCVEATLNLGVSSVGPTSLINGSATSSLMYINTSGVGIGTNNPSSTLHVVGVTTLSNDLSMVHNKSIQLNDANADTVLLIGNYGDNAGFYYGTSTTHQIASLAIEGDVKANRLCIKEDCRAEWTDIQGINYWTASSTDIYSNNDGNVGIGDTEPYNKLSVTGNIFGSESLLITNNGTIMGNLGVGSLPTQTWARYLDLSGSGNSAYLSRTASVTAAFITSETGTPSGTGYNLGHSGQQMALGSLSSHPINFITGATSKMFLSADGKLGIGTTSPASALHIYPQNNIEGLTIVSSNYSPLVITNSSSVNLFRVDEIGRTRSSAYCDIDGNNCFNPGLLGWGTASFFATVTVATYTGNNGGTGGYAHAHELCNTKLVGTHVCSSEEILNTIKLKKTMPQEDVWIFAGPPGYVASVNDCEARSSAATGKYGTYWQGPDSGAGYPLGRGLLATCDSLLKLACCY